MTYTTGQSIVPLDYNTFAQGGAAASHVVANVNTVWGTGNADKGYGQTALTPVSTGNTVTASQWSTMISRVNSCLSHQSGTTSGITAPVTGNTVSVLPTLSTKITDIYNNRLLFNSTRGTPATTNYDAVWTLGPSAQQYYQTRTVTFASGDAARYFFNAGGVIGIALSIPSSTYGNTKITSWNNLLETYFITLTLGYTSNSRSGTGGQVTTNGSALGYYDLTTSDQTLIKLEHGTYGYSDPYYDYRENFVRVKCKSNGPQGSNGDNGSVLTFSIDYDDIATTGEGFVMTMRAGVVITPPETTYLTSSWGTITPASTLN